MHSNPAVHFSVFLNKDVILFDTSRVGLKERGAAAAVAVSGLLPTRDRLVSLAFGPPFQSAPEGELDTHGPLWNCRLEPEIPIGDAAAGSPGLGWFHRITVTSNFSVKRQDTSAVSHSLITLRFGCALVLTMAEYKDYHLFTQHWQFVRLLLHHVTNFGVQSAVSYIGRVLRLSTARHAEAQCQDDPRGIETLLVLRELAHNFVALPWSIPALTSFSGLVDRPPPLHTPKSSAQSSPAQTPQKGVRIHTQFQQKPPQHVDQLLSAAMRHIQTTCSVDYLSAVISGCLACCRWEEYDMEGYFHNDYADYRRQPDMLLLRSPFEDEGEDSGDDASSQDLPDVFAASNTMSPGGILDASPPATGDPNLRSLPQESPQRSAELPSGKRLKLTEANLAVNFASSHAADDPNAAAGEQHTVDQTHRRCSRIVVLADDEEQGASLLIICAFFFRPGKLRFCEHNAASRGVLPCVIASFSDSPAHPSFPIQWVAHRKRQEVMSDLHNRFSIENEVLLIDPRLLKVTLVRFEKNFSTADVVVSRENGDVTEFDGPVFTVRKLDDVDITPNASIKTAIAAAAQAEKKSIGAVNAAESLEGMMELFYHQAQTYRVVVDGGLLGGVDPTEEMLLDNTARNQQLLGVGATGGGDNVSSRSLENKQPSTASNNNNGNKSSSPPMASLSPHAGTSGRALSPMGAAASSGPQYPAAAHAEAAKDAARRYNDSIRRLLGMDADASHLQLLSYISSLKP